MGKTKTLRLFLKTVIDYGICIYLALILALLPWYNREGYDHIGTDKAYFLGNVIVSTGQILLPAFIVYLAVLAIDMRRGFWNVIRRNISLPDIFAAVYGLMLVVSWLCTEYKENALWGAAGWYMGLYPQAAMVLTYLIVSKFWQPRRWMIYLTLVSSGGVFLLGYLNRIRLDPLKMGLSRIGFISTVGNINWYCGYLVSVFFAGAVLLWQGKEMKHLKQLLLMLYILVGFGSLLTQGSDSGFAALVAVLMTMFVLSVSDVGRMQIFWVEMLLLGGAGLITYVIEIVDPDALNYRVGLGARLISGGFFFFVTSVSILAVLLLIRCKKNGNYPAGFLLVFSKIIMTIMSVIILLLITMIIANTLYPGCLGPLSEIPLLTFSLKWGSGRGATWRAAWMCFAEQGMLHKLVGVGPDCMSAYLYTDSGAEIRALLQESFGSVRLTNAHNEWLTVLVNTGILGLTAFGGMIVTGIRRFLREEGHNETVCACGMCLLAYTVNNIFSFQQSLNTATVFAIFGMGGAFLRKQKQQPAICVGDAKPPGICDSRCESLQ